MKRMMAQPKNVARGETGLAIRSHTNSNIHANSVRQDSFG